MKSSDTPPSFRHSAFRIVHSAFCIPHSAFCILHSAFCILLLVPSGAFAASAGTVFNVSTVEELTNALNNANAANCEIRIATGTYDLSGIVMVSGESHLQLWKNGTAGRKIVGMGDGPEDTVLKAGATDGVRILGAHNGIVSNLTFTGASTTVEGGAVFFGTNGGGLFNCVVSNNVSTASGGGVKSSYSVTISGCLFDGNSCTGTSASGGAIGGSKNVVVRDCVFSGNYAGNFGGAFDFGLSFDRCVFIGNEARVGGGVCRPTSSGTRTLLRDCVFLGNHAPKGGVAYYGADWQRCVFVGNYSSAGNGGVALATGLENVFTDCAFTNNYVLGSNSYSCFDRADAATNCVFFGNYATTDGMGLIGACGNVVGCTISCNTGMPLVVSCALQNCRIARNFGNRSNSNPLFKSSTLRNCLLEGNIGGQHNMACLVGTSPSALLNCTVVSNRYWAANYSVADADTIAVNTVFTGNLNRNSLAPADIFASYAPTMTNCIYSVLSGTLAADKATDCLQASTEAIRFEDLAAGDYTPAWKSPARNAGWSDAAYLSALGPLDLVGNPRVFLKDEVGVIDIGCFESQAKSPALRIFVR